MAFSFLLPISRCPSGFKTEAVASEHPGASPPRPDLRRVHATRSQSLPDLRHLVRPSRGDAQSGMQGPEYLVALSEWASLALSVQDRGAKAQGDEGRARMRTISPRSDHRAPTSHEGCRHSPTEETREGSRGHLPRRRVQAALQGSPSPHRNEASRL